MRARDEIEAALTEWSRVVEWPTTPDLDANVVRVVRTSRAAPPRRWRAAAVAAAVAVALLVVPSTRRAVARWLGLGAVSVEVAADLPAVGDELQLGEETTLAAAGLTPEQIPAALGDPAAVFADDAGRVWLVFAPSPSLPEIRPGVGGLLAYLPGVTQPQVHKVIAGGTDLVTTTVGDAAALWIGGGPHTVFLVDEIGRAVEATGRLSANTLVWSAGAGTWRLEADLSATDMVSLVDASP